MTIHGMTSRIVITQSALKAMPYLIATALGGLLASPSGPVPFRIFFALTPVTTLAIARRRVGHEHLATVHNLDSWRIDSHSDTTPATGAVAHQLAL